jgi:predicted MFS family arabinose efflux permease
MTQETPIAHPPHSVRGLFSVFASTLFQLSGIFMLSPMLLILLKGANVSTTVAGLFAATTWLGIFIMTPFASALTQRIGRRESMWLATVVPLLSALGYMLTDNLWIWFVLQLLAGVAGGMRWVLTEAFIAEFAPPRLLGRYVGGYAAMVGATFVIGPSLLAWVGAESRVAPWLVVGLLTLGLLWTAFIPPLPPDHDSHSAEVGLAGLWRALKEHPVIMLAGFMGGFFELGLASTLPLYGMAIGLGASGAALLVSVSGAGGTLVAMPAGMVADWFSSPARGRRWLMLGCMGLIVSASLALFGVGQLRWLVWPVVAVWGAAGAALYTLSMVDIGTRDKGIALVNSTAVLVLTYTLGGLVASGASGWLMDQSLRLGFPLVLVVVAASGLFALLRTRKQDSI